MTDREVLKKGIWGKTSDGKWHKAQETTGDYFFDNFRYDKYSCRLQRKIIRKGVETWINATDKQVYDWHTSQLQEYEKKFVSIIGEDEPHMNHCNPVQIGPINTCECGISDRNELRAKLREKVKQLFVKERE